MKLALMQPYFLPYLGYFSLIKSADHFVFFDTPQYIRRGWMNRNRIIHPKDGANYITIPIEKAPRETPINKIKISYSSDWVQKIFGQLEVYKKRATHYKEVVSLLQDILKEKYTHLSLLNIESTLQICKYLEMDVDHSVFSKLEVNVETAKSADEWGLNTTKALGYTTYINPPGGMGLYESDKYNKAGIKLEYIKNRLSPYNQHNQPFIPGLSIIDAMMFCSVNEVKSLIDDYEIL